jgi:D-sedoheptulose 7-phosphate isomerase
VQDISLKRFQSLFAEVCWLRFHDFLSRLASVQTTEAGGAKSAGVCVSVVIPTRNRPALVVKAVTSALNQDFENCEVIVVIDGEDRRTMEVLAGVSDLRLRIIGLAANVGAAEARNVGVREARGEWIAFLDDDDEWLPHKLSWQIAAARRSRAVWPVISSRVIVRTAAFEVVRPMRAYEPEKPVSDFLFCRRSLRDGPFAMQTSTLMMQRDLMLAVPFRKGLKRHQDWDWLLRAERAPGVEFAVVGEPLAIYRTEDGRESLGLSQDWELSVEWAGEMRRFFSAKAYSWFLASECISRAVKSRAGFKVRAEIARRFAMDGAPSLGSVVTAIFFLGLPRAWRKGLHGLVRRWRRNSARGFYRMEAACEPQSEWSFDVKASEYTRRYLTEVGEIASLVDGAAIDSMVDLLCETRVRGGRVFFLGVGGGAGHASHAVNDFRKIAGMECYAPTDNVSELTARINDDGWESCYANWLQGSRLSAKDMVFVFSVGGGCVKNRVSLNLVESLKLARRVGAAIAGIVGRDGGYTAKVADACIVVPSLSADTVTAHTESFQAVIWHLLVSHPRLKRDEMKWEQVSGRRAERSFSIAMA